jgi:hypothetical protein
MIADCRREGKRSVYPERATRVEPVGQIPRSLSPRHGFFSRDSVTSHRRWGLSGKLSVRDDIERRSYPFHRIIQGFDKCPNMPRFLHAQWNIWSASLGVGWRRQSRRGIASVSQNMREFAAAICSTGGVGVTENDACGERGGFFVATPERGDGRGRTLTGRTVHAPRQSAASSQIPPGQCRSRACCLIPLTNAAVAIRTYIKLDGGDLMRE